MMMPAPRRTAQAGDDRSFCAAERVSVAPPGSATLRILHLDDACVVVDKPAGCVSVPGRGVLAEGSVAQQLQAIVADAQVVHRLDMATSGVLLFARGAERQRHFHRAFAQRTVVKRYIARVGGRLGDGIGACGEIDLPLAADWPNRPRQRVDLHTGKASLTRWQASGFAVDGSWTRLQLVPVTGRSHQLRVHLAAISHPILGDPLYGPVGDTAAAPGRLMLHAFSIGFEHPSTSRWLQVESPAPF